MMFRILWSAGLAMTLLHAAAPFPYDDYQVPVYGMLAAALIAGWFRRIPAAEEEQTAPAFLTLLLALGCAVTIAGSPIHQDWMIRGRDRIWWQSKDQTDLHGLQEAARWLRENTTGDLLLTQDLYLAVEAGKRVPEGLGMGPFCLYPEWSMDQAERRKVMNPARMEDLIKNGGVEWAAFSGYGLSIASPNIEPLDTDIETQLRSALDEHYEPVKKISHFGQAHTELVIYKRRPGDDL